MKSEFQKRMDLLDPGYVVPPEERVANRKPIAIRPEPIQKNEAGLAILPDQPVNEAMQELYLRRMMDVDAAEALQQDEGTLLNAYEQAALMQEIAKKRGK